LPNLIYSVFALRRASFNSLQGQTISNLEFEILKAAFSSTGTLACAGFAALTIDAQPRVAVLLDFFRDLFRR
jgi:hypothetical protein